MTERERDLVGLGFIVGLIFGLLLTSTTAIAFLELWVVP